MTGVSSLTYELLQHQDDTTSRAVHDALRGEAQFTALAKVEGASLLERDRKDAIKLREGIDLAVRRGLLTPVPPGRAFPVCKIDVHETSADDIANRILEKLPIHDTTTGLLITLQGLSGTGKGTTVKKLQKALMSQPTASGAPMRCVAWSNGNVFRAFTWLLWQRYQAQQHAKTTPNMNEIDIERSYVSPGRVDENDPTSPWTFEQFIVPEELSYCSRQLIFERRVDVRDEQECDKSTMCGFDIAMTVTNLTVPLTSPVKHIPGVPCAPSHGGTGDMGTTSSDDRSVLYVTDIAETLLKDANVSKRVPTVAEQTQGEVIQFTQHALHVLQSSGVHVILEGREETLQYITTPLRFELVQPEAETILGQRRAAQRVMALAYEHVLAESGNRKATEQKQDEVARSVLLKALNELSSGESSVDNKQSKHPVAGGSTRIQCGCC